MEQKEQIEQIKIKLKRLHEIYANEIHESWTQGHQTQMMIEQYEEQLSRLEEDQSKPNTYDRKYTLKEENGNDIKTFYLTERSPDPSKGILSVNSPIGAKLLASKNGDKIEIGDRIYNIT